MTSPSEEAAMVQERVEGRMRIFNPRPLLKWMQRHDIDRNQLAEMIDVVPVTIKKITGAYVDPSLRTIAAIHRVTKIPYDMMIKDDAK
mgnify:CR=1 FL=1